jgi:hypothetical protein
MFRASSLENSSLSQGRPTIKRIVMSGWQTQFGYGKMLLFSSASNFRERKSGRRVPNLSYQVVSLHFNDRVVGRSGSNLRIYSRLAPIPTVHVSPGGSVTVSPAPADERNGRNKQTERNDQGERNDSEERDEGSLKAVSRKGAGPDSDERSRIEEGNGPKERSQQSEVTERNERNGYSARNGRNERASWVAGHVVHGDAVLASVGTTYSSLGKLRWDDVTTGEWHR